MKQICIQFYKHRPSSPVRDYSYSEGRIPVT